MDQKNTASSVYTGTKITSGVREFAAGYTLEAVSRKYNIVTSVIIRWRKAFKEKQQSYFRTSAIPEEKRKPTATSRESLRMN